MAMTVDMETRSTPIAPQTGASTTVRIKSPKMSYPGNFTFIIRDIDTPPKAKNFKDDSAIFAHVARTRQTWRQNKRKELLGGLKHPNQKTADSKVAIPNTPASLRTKDPARVLGPATAANKTLRSIGCPVHPESSPHCVQCKRLRNTLQRYDTLISSVHMLKGNSDPFSASAVPISYETHQHLQLSSQFLNFWAWSMSASSILRSKAKLSWLENVRSALQGATEMRVILAMGAAQQAKMFAQCHNEEAHRRSSAQALMHKTKALTCLRENIEGDGQPGFLALLQLISLEFFEGNYDNAILHHTAASALIARDKDWEHRHSVGQPKRTVHALAEVWAAAAVLNRPAACGVVDFAAHRADFSGALPAPPSTNDFFLFEREWTALHSSVTAGSLRRVFNDIRKVTMYLDQLLVLNEDQIEAFETVVYLESQSTAIRAEILEMLADVDAELRLLACDKNTDVSDTSDDLVFLATCLAALLYINVVFMYKVDRNDPNEESDTAIHVPAKPLMSPSINHRALQRLQDILQKLYQRNFDAQLAGFDAQMVDFDLMIWLSFITALTEILEMEECHRQNSSANGTMETGIGVFSAGVGMQYFNSYCTVLRLGSWRHMREILKQFCYFGGLMDGYLKKMFEDAM